MKFFEIPGPPLKVACLLVILLQAISVWAIFDLDPVSFVERFLVCASIIAWWFVLYWGLLQRKAIFINHPFAMATTLFLGYPIITVFIFTTARIVIGVGSKE